MEKCTLCKNKIQETFLNKKIGTAKVTGKKVEWICRDCQRKETQQ